VVASSEQLGRCTAVGERNYHVTVLVDAHEQRQETLRTHVHENTRSQRRSHVNDEKESASRLVRAA
jgi:hypothetical protein